MALLEVEAKLKPAGQSLKGSAENVFFDAECQRIKSWKDIRGRYIVSFASKTKWLMNILLFSFLESLGKP